MRPISLPPLIIPKRHSPVPVLLGNYQDCQQRQMEVPISRFRLVHRSPPNSPRPEPQLEIEDIDHIDLFKFYNPCLLPPTPIRPRPATQFVELPADSRHPAPCPNPSLRRSRHTVTRRGRSYRRHTSGTPYPRRAPSRSPSQPPPYSPGPAQARSPSPPQAPQPRRVSLPRWALSDLEDTAVGEEPDVERGATPDSEQTSDVGHNTPYAEPAPGLESRPGVVDEYGYPEQAHQQEQAALRELWGVIDGMLGPDTNLGDYDARSVSAASSIYSPWEGTGVDGWNDALRQGSNGSGDRVHGVCEAPQKAGWWRAFRQGLLLS
ncbi:hypothetical protein C8A03DRAFT_37197 [Achaetomium macrosporum]|uniref:Uncharacterized protein n=1 Tax=Achaetomium macrosporum TaxID=79813 RepID=A0AAN7C584_9PEZI|nr:hypothetical protein C8A03DRAFT_37197 [Achaetomium macrosporum]